MVKRKFNAKSLPPSDLSKMCHNKFNRSILNRVFVFTGLDYWTGLLDWTTGLDYWTDL